MPHPLRHISIRVPWHDTGWDGRVCNAPRLNGSCLELKRIAEVRNDEAEERVAGKSLKDLPEEQWPCCVAERVGFMAPFEYTRDARHPYNRGADTKHGHFAPTPLRHPPYSAAAVPFEWLLVENMDLKRQEHDLEVDLAWEPKDLGFTTQWVQDYRNHKALLECFAGHLKPGKSLCFFYAKQVPFLEDAGGSRVLIGVGRVIHVSEPQEYSYSTKNLNGKLRSMLWELLVQHSIRPDFKDGFLLPYHAAVTKATSEPGFDPAEIAAIAPADRILEFSHVSQLVTHDGAIASLLACAESLHKAKGTLAGPWDQCLKWIDARLSELWKFRGPCPGLGAALSAFGLELGNFVAQSLAEKVGENNDPWPMVDQVFSAPGKYLPGALAQSIGKTLSAKWSRLPEGRRALLKLISRFEIDANQAKSLYVEEERSKAGIDCSDSSILSNPYLIYEATRLAVSSISVWTVDRGVFPDEVIRKKHPLPEPTGLDAGTDSRRVRALTVDVLERAGGNGNTLLSQEQIVLEIRRMALQPPCEVDGDLMAVAKDDFGGALKEVRMANGAPALQLMRLAEMGELIRAAIDRRVKGRRLDVAAHWRSLLDERLKSQGAAAEPDEFEGDARAEKIAALQEIAESRVSVLIGPAGTGKTTLLSVLCSHEEIASEGILLLAPTGKARVRMQQAAEELKLRGYTIAQFLSPHRYNSTTGQYHLSERPGEFSERTVIIDEASMLTEEMLGALLQALKGVHRLILIGDPHQLPPIGPGRPFVDIVARLAPEGIAERFPRVGPGYCELTIRRRQTGEDREDLRLAEWFSGSIVGPGEDDVFDKVVAAGQSKHVRFIEWTSPDDLRSSLFDALVEELRLTGPDDVAGFDQTLGAVPWKDFRFFNLGSARKADGWQILSPVRSTVHGVPYLNRLIHKQFRQGMIDSSRLEGWDRKFPKPMGPEEIVYGDKVINLMNTDPKQWWNKHRKVYPAKDDAYIANGEIGRVVGFFRRKGLPDLRWKLEVEFASQSGYKYDFTGRDFGEDSNPRLELAYALTVHKSQGSEFGTVFFVVPNACRSLSRELLYTALTRQKKRIIILYQGPRTDLRKYSSDSCSEIARRLSNIFVPPSPVMVDGRFYEEHLIHRTAKGEMVRSKSEVIIADHLSSTGIEYAYEQPLTIDGITRYPDFTIEDAASGRTILWEHCGMLHVPTYRRRWEEKLDWYRSHGIVPRDEGEGLRATLIVTRDESNGSIDSLSINRLVSEVFSS